MPAADTIPRRILDQARRRPASHAYFAKQAGVWRPTTWRHYVDEIRTAARALIALGLPRGGKVAILGFNRPEWVIFDHAAMMAGGVPAGIYTTCSAEEVQYIVHHCEAHVVLVEDLGQWKKIAAQKSNLPLLRHVVTMKGCPPIDDPMVLSWEAFLAKAAPIADQTLDDRIDAIEPGELATLIYTSGTTGPPKGVMLTHKNLAWTAQTMIDHGGARAGDSTLSYLPLSHIAEQMTTILLPATAGATVYFAESIEKVPDNLREVPPTGVFGVPAQPTLWRRPDGTEFRIVGQSHELFVLVEVEGELWVVDQHASHERVIYEQVLETLHRRKGEAQPLLLPITFELAPTARAALEEAQEYLTALGFDIQPFGGAAYQVQATPPYFRASDTPELIIELAQARADGRSENSVEAKIEDLAARVACKVKSVKAGQTLTPEAMKALVKSLLDCRSPFVCPHGRPTMVRLSVQQLAGQFDRR